MKKRLFFLSSLLFIAALVSCGNTNSSIDDSKSNNSISEAPSSNTGSALLSSLHTECNKNKKTLTYTEAWTVLALADADPLNSDNVICLYSGYSISKSKQDTGSGNDAWNREHVWPQSHGLGSKNSAKYDDCHNLHASYKPVNEKRGNLDFDNVKDVSNVITDTYGNKYISSGSYACYEPRDSVKGDCARTIFYMLACYSDLSGVSTIPSSGSSFGNIKTLLAWNELDPVSDFEINRNNIVYEYQGNKNPFIDNPEYANLIWGDSTSNLGNSNESSDDKFGVKLWSDEPGPNTVNDTSNNNVIMIVIICAILLLGGFVLAFIIIKYINEIKRVKENEKEDVSDDRKDNS